MIMSSPFSRLGKAQQSWHSSPTQNGSRSPQLAINGLARSSGHPPHSTSSLRRPATAAPEVAANDLGRESPRHQHQKHVAHPASNNTDRFRSSTLSRLDMIKRREATKRNLSSLGHYPPAQPAPPPPPPPLPLSSGEQSRLARPIAPTNGLQNGHAPNGLIHSTHNHRLQALSRLTQPARVDSPGQIYAPASIASPREFAPFYGASGQQQHYAATSVQGGRSSGSFGPTDRSSRSGRESALSGLLDRFGTLKRKARRRWPSLSIGRLSRSSQRGGGASAIYASPSSLGTEAGGRPDQEEIYASKKILEADQVYADGLRAIDSNCRRRLLEHELDPALMHEGETRTLIEAESARQTNFTQLVSSLTNWINDELAEQRIIVRDLQDDLYDGQVLCKLLERLHRIKLDIIEVTQNELAQMHRLKVVLSTLNRILALQARWARIRWTAEGIHAKNMVEIVQLLVTLALFYRAPIRMPSNVIVTVIVFQRHHNQLIRRSHQAQLTDDLVVSLDLSNGSNSAASEQYDAFDTLLECAPEKLPIVEQSLVKFCNRHLNKLNMSCEPKRRGLLDDEAPPTVTAILDPNQFSDGLLLVFLISSLEDYFVPMGNLFTEIERRREPLPASRPGNRPTNPLLPFIDHNNNNRDHNIYINTASPTSDHYQLDFIDQPTALEPTSYINTQPIERLHNVNVALQLIEEAGVDIRQRVRAEDIVNGDLKAVLRVLYALFSRYKHL